MGRNITNFEGVKRKEAPVSDTLRYLIERSGKTVQQIAEETGISVGTLYSINSRTSSRADVRILKALADYFEEDISIFCGLDEYNPPKKLTEREQALLNRYNSLTDVAKDKIDGYIIDVAENPKNRLKEA